MKAFITAALLLFSSIAMAQEAGTTFAVKYIKEGKVAAMSGKLYQPDKFKDTHLIEITQKGNAMGRIQVVESYNLYLIRVEIIWLEKYEQYVIPKADFRDYKPGVRTFENSDLQIYESQGEVYVVKAAFSTSGLNQYFYIPLYAQAISEWILEVQP